MSIESKHPDFIEVSDDYRVMRDTFAGERRVKEAGFLYLPATAGQVMDGATKGINTSGYLAYVNYLTRSRFPDLVKQAVGTQVGVMVREPAVIKLPAKMESLRESATRKGESLQALLRRIYEQQLEFGRIGLLADFPQDEFAAGQAELPHLVEYDAESIINWDDERFAEFGTNILNFLVLNETVQVRGKGGAEIFDWQEERRFRVAVLEPVDPEFPLGISNPLVYKTFVQNDDVRTDEVTPSFKGVTMEEVPFTFIGSNDLNAKPDEIPLLGLARLALHIYRSGADYYHALHVIGSDTLVIAGEEITASGDAKDEAEPTRVGTGAIIRLDAEGKAEFIGINSDGIPEQRTAIQNDLVEAREHGARLLEPRKGQAESGEALRARISSATANLHQIALTGAAGLERSLKQVAVWVGADPDEVEVIPNLDFTQAKVDPKKAKDLIEAKRDGGLKISDKSIHTWMQDNNLTRLTFEEEQEAIDNEEEPVNKEPASVVVNNMADPAAPAAGAETIPPAEPAE
jgi:hypothetical protein